MSSSRPNSQLERGDSDANMSSLPDSQSVSAYESAASRPSLLSAAYPSQVDTLNTTGEFGNRQDVENDNAHESAPMLTDGPTVLPSLRGMDSQNALVTPSADYSNEKLANLLTPKESGSDLIAQTSSKRPSRFSQFRLSRRQKLIIFLLIPIIVIVVALAVILPVYFKIIRPRQQQQTRIGGSSPIAGIPSSGQWNPGSPTGDISGGNGSMVITEDGTKFMYNNSFGGYWVQDIGNPFLNAARPNSWTPALNESWTWGQDKIYGVNLGGWLVLEPFITPALYQQYQNLSYAVDDEWSLSTAMRQYGNITQQMEEHYSTFITEVDFAQIAAAGLNWVRLPVPYWAVPDSVWSGEPFLEGVAWTYALKAFQWARKYGLRIYIDLHTIPGSQNGYNHSGRLGTVNFLYGLMGIANAQRALDYIRTITEFIAQPEWAPLFPIWGIVNEALEQTIGMDILTTFYLESYYIIRNITGIGEGNGPFISIHDGFIGEVPWYQFLRGADRFVMDTHPYTAFDGAPNNQPLDQWASTACNNWAGSMNDSQKNFGVTVAGEWSVGFCDCGLYLKGVEMFGENAPASYGGNCSLWMDASQWNDTVKQDLMNFALAEMDALQNWFFWTWKIAPSNTSNVESPLWSYSLGLEGGWIPTDPRRAVGTCTSLNTTSDPFNGTFQSWQTGGIGAGTIDPSSLSTLQFPPTTISGIAGFTSTGAPAAFLPTYTPTATIETMSVPKFTDANGVSINAGDGWKDSSDTASFVTTVSGCSYPDAWSANGLSLPTALCPPGSTNAALTTTGTTTTSASITSAPA